MSYSTASGLYVKTGTAKGIPTPAGEYMSHDNGTRVIELNILDLTTLTSTAVIQGDVTPIPANSMIESITVIADTAATSAGSATLNIGMTLYDRTTAVSDVAFVSALALTAIDATGETNSLTKGSTGAGTLVGTTTGTAPGLLTAKYGTAAFTAGAVRVRVRYRGIGTITQ